MPLGIRPLVDFAFKMIFGNPKHVEALIGLLNAILCLKHPITSVEILNPFNYQEFQDAKQIILDVRARDAQGRWMNVEMQVSAVAGLLKRMVYYSCSMYVEQLHKGDDYRQLRQSIAICLTNQSIDSGSSQPHHRYQLLDQQSGRIIGEAVEVHTVELAKYDLSEHRISSAPPIQQWAFFLLRAQEFDPRYLRELLPAVEFQTAISVAQQIAHQTEDKVMYDQREKAQRDHDWAIACARDEGLEQGAIAGQIQLIQELLDETPSSKTDLTSQSVDQLRVQLDALRQRLRSRES
ncbi:MAG: Rpn family recombination-promoting nuclease/putative transposase [Pirellulaceae bacterium]